MNFDIDVVLKFCLYFFVYSSLGWTLETVYKSIAHRKFINSGFLFGPFCPIYGIGAIIMILLLEPFTNNYLLLFLVAFVVLSVWEYIVGWLLEKAFNTTYWDYSNEKFNIKGRVCLKNSFIWGILSIVFINIIHPYVADLVSDISFDILIYTNILLYSYFVTDSVISIIKVMNINIKLETLEELTNRIKIKIEELNDTTIKTYNTQKLIDDLKQKQAELREKVYIQTKRLRNAFPTMRSEKISKYLYQKLEEIKSERFKNK